jgi:putative membrane protein
MAGFCFLGGGERGLVAVLPLNRYPSPADEWSLHDGGTMILQSLAGLPAFLVYTRITPHDEFQLIRDNDPAAAIALGLSLLGFVAPLVSAIAHSANVLDCLIWAMIALIVQIIVLFLVKVPVPNLSARIAAGELAPAIWLGLSSLAAGLLDAACMIY